MQQPSEGSKEYAEQLGRFEKERLHRYLRGPEKRWAKRLQEDLTEEFAKRVAKFRKNDLDEPLGKVSCCKTYRGHCAILETSF